MAKLASQNEDSLVHTGDLVPLVSSSHNLQHFKEEAAAALG